MGEEVGKGTSNREDQGMRLVPILWHCAGTRFMALSGSGKYQSQIQWPLEHLQICVACR